MINIDDFNIITFNFVSLFHHEWHFFFSFNSPDNVAHLSSPGPGRRGRRNQRREVEWEDDERQRDPLIAEQWSSATLKILSSMPSRTIGGSCRELVEMISLPLLFKMLCSSELNRWFRSSQTALMPCFTCWDMKVSRGRRLAVILLT